MLRKTVLWIIALLVTLASAYYQRVTGPTYPISGSTTFAGTTVEYKLARSQGGEDDQEVAVVVPNAHIAGRLLYKRYKTSDAWTGLPMTREGDRLVGYLPNQPPAGKLEYSVELYTGSDRAFIPATKQAVVTRFKGEVPAWALLPHIFLIFLAMLFSVRTALEAVFSEGEVRGFALWTLGLMAFGGLVFGPIVQKFAFGEYWTGFPFGMDLTDNKTAISFLAWLIAVLAVWNRGYRFTHPGRRWYSVAAAVVTLVVFLIPHSMFGSELDYSKQPRVQQDAPSPRPQAQQPL